ncbi:excisionase family DNA-binding protein [Actinomadura litoris]|uniref:excisionase family DNA-binding protein n=1 Tax=Actinomadura litoris TaxID=2678616 RepID=UPI001FA73A73|nr:excisionase family DNA-binding protein [Actinomadura litoris]
MTDATDAIDTEPWSRERIAALGPTTDVPTAASVLGIGAWTVYELIRRNEWDSTRVLRLGRRIRIPTQDLVRLLYALPVDEAPVVSAATTV